MPTFHLLVKGKVQGVFYRATAKEVADKLGLVGWVKNTDINDVELVVAGDQTSVDRFIAWCKQGPPRAKVTSVVITEHAETGLSGFIIKR
jgi:acylphosphatase